MKLPSLLLVSCAAAVATSSLRAESPSTPLFLAAMTGGVPRANTSPARTLAETGPSKRDLEKLFEDTQWVATSGGRTFIFHRGGILTDSGGWASFYFLEKPNILTLGRGKPSKTPEKFMTFKVNVEAKTAEQDLQAGTAGGNMTIKFDGPAKRVK